MTAVAPPTSPATEERREPVDGHGRPLWLDLAPNPIFATFHPAHVVDGKGTEPTTAVLICPPWGWDEVTSYRGRRAWAEDLATAGFPTLRIDLPGAGDSAGSPDDPDLVSGWSGAIDAAARWLSARPGVGRVAAIGLGLGGLLAMRAIRDGAPIDTVVLWAVPPNGRTYLRELRAFSAMQSTQVRDAAGTVDGSKAMGGLEAGGFALSAATMQAMSEIDIAEPPLAGLERAMVLVRPGMAGDAAVANRLEQSGVPATRASGSGWTEMVFHPEQYAPAVTAFRTVSEWFASLPPPQRRVGTTSIAEVSSVELAAGDRDRSIRETPIRIPRPFGDLFGIVAQAPEAPTTDLCAIFLNAGAVRRIGPNRLWVETARRWAARGVPSVRMDMEGIGDSDGDPARYADVGQFYTAEAGASVDAVINAMAARGLGPRFVVVGLCAGGYWAFHRGAADPRIVAALVLNPRALVWDSGLLSRREARKVERLLEPHLWKRIAQGKIGASRMVAVSRAVASRAVASVRRGPGAHGQGTTAEVLDGALDALRQHGTRVVLAFSGNEPVHDELAASGILEGLHDWPNVVLDSLPASDHTLRPLVAQAAARELLDRELNRLIDRPG